MARKRGEHQKRKIQRDKIQNLMICCILLIGALVFIIDGTQEAITARDIAFDNLQEYRGGFIFFVRQTNHNTTYIFQLENGDRVEIPNIDSTNIDTIGDHSRLVFRYSRFRSWIRLGTYEGVAVLDASFQNEFYTVDGQIIKGKATTLILCGIFQFLVCVVLLIPNAFLLRIIGRKR